MENLNICLPIAALWLTSSTMLGFFVKRTPGGHNPGVRYAVMGFLLAAFCTLAVWPGVGESVTTFSGLLLMDSLGAIVSLIVILAGLATVLFSNDYFERAGWNLPEVPLLIVVAVSGMIVMVTSDHLPVIFLGLEIMSLSLYGLCASIRNRQHSLEAGTKYYLTGAFASGIFLLVDRGRTRVGVA